MQTLNYDDYETFDWIMARSHVYLNKGIWCPDTDDQAVIVALQVDMIEYHTGCGNCGMRLK